MRKITTAEALAQIQDGATIAISGNGGGMVEADHIMAAIEARFLQTGHPRDLTLIHSLGIGDRDCKGNAVLRTQRCSNALLPGTLPASPKMQALVKNNTIEAYCFPGGVIQALLREIGAGRPGLFTHVGLGSFVDPRNGGGKSNECTTDDLETDRNPWKPNFVIALSKWITRFCVALMPILEATSALKKKRLIWIAIPWRWQHTTAAAKCSYRYAMCWKLARLNHAGSNYRASG
ncbi:CoA-transferase [Escherichia coli]